jgi:voltage-gated potassium channel
MIPQENSSPGRTLYSPFNAIAVRMRRGGSGWEQLLATVGLAGFVLGTLPDVGASYDAALTGLCLAVAALFAIALVVELWPARHGAAAPSGGSRGLRGLLNAAVLIDLAAAIPIPLALLFGTPHGVARLLGVFWSLKLVRRNSAFALLVRVLRNEGQALTSVAMTFAVVVLFASTAAYVVERAAQPDQFGSIPAALWWAVTTVTTTGYGDKVPATGAGRILAGAVMVCGIGLFALWAGILASGFAQELRRSEVLESWNLIVKLPLFRRLGAPALSEITRLLKVQKLHSGAAVVREGQPGDSMFFIAEGEVEVRAAAGPVRLGPGDFFGEMALVRGGVRNATVVAASPVRLLRLDVVDFRDLAGRHPDLLAEIEAASLRRESVESGERAAERSR